MLNSRVASVGDGVVTVVNKQNESQARAQGLQGCSAGGVEGWGGGGRGGWVV